MHRCSIKKGQWLCRCGRRFYNWEGALSVALNIISDSHPSHWLGGRPPHCRSIGNTWSIFWDRPSKRLKLYKGRLTTKMPRTLGAFISKPHPSQKEIARIFLRLSRTCPPEGPRTKSGFGQPEWQKFMKEQAKNV